MHRILLFLIVLAGPAAYPQKYKDPSLTVEQRVQDLLSKMTLEEKVGQLLCPLGWEMYERNGEEVTHSERFEKFVNERHIGSLWAVYRADPWTKKTLENGLRPELAAKAGNALQRYVVEHTRLGIPLFLAEEAPHGHMAIGTTVFPTGIGLAATWSEQLLEEAGAVISREIRLQGGHIGYGPVLDLLLDPRWSRVEETFGEDPVLSGTLGSAMIRGEGAGDLSKPFSVVSTLKHFLAYGVPLGGHNGNPASVGQRDLLENFLPPFEAAIEAGALSVMTSYNSVDGVPCTSSNYLLTEILRKRVGFTGFVVSDLGSIEGIKGSHYVAETIDDAAILAVGAGTDSDLGGEAFLKLTGAVKDRRIKEAVIDTAVSRILRLKFKMGLFENPYVNPEAAAKNVRTAAHIDVARRAARESIVLLGNRNNILPLSKKIRRIAVIGPNADNRYNMLGDYTAPQHPSNVVTVLDGIRSKLGASCVEYVRGCAIRDTLNAEIERAVSAARKADVAVVVVGGSSARDFRTRYIETGAAVATQESISDMESGEGFDRATLDLLGRQSELLRAVKATGKPVVVVYIQGRPLNMNWAAEHADALLTAWYPGQEGGNAIADVLFGDYNPAGRLPVSVPRHEGQIPVHYNKLNPLGHDYVEMPSSPLFSFGYGLSYTSFDYNDLKVVQKGRYDFEVSFLLKNSGERDGDEVVQLYLRDEFASTVRPVMQLRHFRRIFLKKGEERRLIFRIGENDLSLLDTHMRRLVEPGSFRLLIGPSSNNTKLQSELVVSVN